MSFFLWAWTQIKQHWLFLLSTFWSLVLFFIKFRGGKMFEGNEIDKKFGSGGAAIVDVSDKGVAKAEASWNEGGLKASLALEVDVVEILEKLALKTDNKIDDGIVAAVKGALGR